MNGVNSGVMVSLEKPFAFAQRGKGVPIELLNGKTLRESI